MHCWSCQYEFVNYIFLTSPCQSPACIHAFFKKVHVCLVVHEYKHEVPLKKKTSSCVESHCRRKSSPPFPVFSALTCKGGADGSVPFLLLLAEVYFAPTLRPSLWMPPTPSSSPGPGVPCGGPHSSNTWEINQTLCWQLFRVKQEDGELHETSGIHDSYFHNWLKERGRLKEASGEERGLLFLKERRSFHFKRTWIEWEIPPCVKYLESVSVWPW